MLKLDYILLLGVMQADYFVRQITNPLNEMGLINLQKLYTKRLNMKKESE